MTDPATLHSNADKLAEIKLKQKQREDGIRAQAIQEGMRKKEAEIVSKLGTAALESGPAIAEIKSQHRAELDRRDALHAHALTLRDREEAKHAVGAAWKGVAIGFWVGVLTVACILYGYTMNVMNGTFDASERFQFQKDVVRTLGEAAE